MLIMDITFIVLFIVALIAIFYLLMRWEGSIKRDYKEKAITLLAAKDPDLKEVKDTIKHLRLYSGRIIKDKEAIQLSDQLRARFGNLY